MRQRLKLQQRLLSGNNDAYNYMELLGQVKSSQVVFINIKKPKEQ